MSYIYFEDASTVHEYKLWGRFIIDDKVIGIYRLLSCLTVEQLVAFKNRIDNEISERNKESEKENV